MKTAYLTLTDFFAVFKKNILLILSVALLFGASGGITRALLPADYTAEVAFYVRNPQGKDYLDTYGLTSSQLAVVQTLAKDYAGLVREGGALRAWIIEKYSLPLDDATLANMIDAAPDDTTFRVTVRGKDPSLVKQVTDALAAETADWVNRTAWPYLYEQFTCVILLETPAAPVRSSWHPVSVALFAAALGAVLAYLVALVCFLWGATCRDAEELQRVLPDVPLLGDISKQKPDCEMVALRNHIITAFSDFSHPVVALIGENTPMAASLAEVLARTGRRVLLVTPASFEGKPTWQDCLANSGLSFAEGIKEGAPALLSLGDPRQGADLYAAPANRIRINDLTAGYDYTVLDLTSCPTATALSLSAVVTGYVAVATPRRTKHAALRRMAMAIPPAGGKLSGLLSVTK